MTTAANYGQPWLIALIIGLFVNIGLFYALPYTGWPIYWVANLLWFAALTWVSFRMVAKAVQLGDSTRFLALVLGSLLADLVGGVVFIVFAIRVLDASPVDFFLVFGMHYVAFTLIKVINLLSLTKAIDNDR